MNHLNVSQSKTGQLNFHNQPLHFKKDNESMVVLPKLKKIKTIRLKKKKKII